MHNIQYRLGRQKGYYQEIVQILEYIMNEYITRIQNGHII